MASIPATNAQIEPVATWQVMLAGVDITSRFDPKLLTLRISQSRQEKADKLSIELDDADGKLVLPPANATLMVSLGWARGSGVPVGIVGMGTYVVDDIEWSGPPDRVTINAHSADMRDSFRTRKTRTWTAQTLGAITAQIAGEQGLTPRCHPDLSGITVSAAEQHNQSDMEFLRNLGRRYDAVATVKAAAVILAPMNATTTATGATLPAVAINRQSGDHVTYRRSAREGTYKGAEANWHDQDGATRQLHHEGDAPRKRLKRIYATQSDAQAAAQSEHQRQQRVAASLDVSLAYGNAQIAPGQRASVSGYKAEINATSWTVSTTEHQMGPGGFTTTLTLEVAGEGSSD